MIMVVGWGHGGGIYIIFGFSAVIVKSTTYKIKVEGVSFSCNESATSTILRLFSLNEFHGTIGQSHLLPIVLATNSIAAGSCQGRAHWHTAVRVAIKQTASFIVPLHCFFLPNPWRLDHGQTTTGVSKEKARGHMEAGDLIQNSGYTGERAASLPQLCPALLAAVKAEKNRPSMPSRHSPPSDTYHLFMC